MKITKVVSYTLGTVIALSLLACGMGGGDGTKPATGEVAASAEAKDAPKDGPVIAQLGSKGLVFQTEKIDVAISKPGTYKPGAYMERPAKGERAFVLTVTVINHNKQAINLTTISITASVGEASAEADQIFDAEAGLKGAPDTALLPGKTAKFKIGFKAAASEAHPVVNVNVNPWELSGLNGTTGLFQGKL